MQTCIHAYAVYGDAVVQGSVGRIHPTSARASFPFRLTPATCMQSAHDWMPAVPSSCLHAHNFKSLVSCRVGHRAHGLRQKTQTAGALGFQDHSLPCSSDRMCGVNYDRLRLLWCSTITRGHWQLTDVLRGGHGTISAVRFLWCGGAQAAAPPRPRNGGKRPGAPKRPVFALSNGTISITPTEAEALFSFQRNTRFSISSSSCVFATACFRDLRCPEPGRSTEQTRGSRFCRLGPHPPDNTRLCLGCVVHFRSSFSRTSTT